MAKLTGAAKIDDFDSRPLRVAEKNIFRLEVTVDNAQLGRREEEEGCTELLSKLARQIEGNAAEVCIPEEIVQIVRQQLKDKTKVVPPHEMSF